MAEYWFKVSEAEKGQRLDCFLTLHCPEVSRSLMARLIKSGEALVSGQSAKPSTLVLPEQEIYLKVPPPPPLIAKADSAVDFTVIYQDDHLLMVDKPAGVVVHPAAGNYEGTLVAGLLAYDPGLSQVGPEGRPGLVHRLDKDTSGALVIARSEVALGRLGQAFSDRQIDKVYLAFTQGLPPKKSGFITDPIGRHPTQRHKMSIKSNKAREAKTSYRVLKTFPGNIGLLKLKIYTGRTHQIRVHLASIGCPVLGDSVYGRPLKPLLKEHPTWSPYLERQLLHARRLSFKHPLTNQPLTFRAPWPPDMLAMLYELLKI